MNNQIKVGDFVILVSPSSTEDLGKIVKVLNITENGYVTGHNTLDNEFSVDQFCHLDDDLVNSIEF